MLNNFNHHLHHHHHHHTISQTPEIINRSQSQQQQHHLHQPTQNQQQHQNHHQNHQQQQQQQHNQQHQHQHHHHHHQQHQHQSNFNEQNHHLHPGFLMNNNQTQNQNQFNFLNQKAYHQNLNQSSQPTKQQNLFSLDHLNHFNHLYQNSVSSPPLTPSPSSASQTHPSSAQLNSFSNNNNHLPNQSSSSSPASSIPFNEFLNRPASTRTPSEIPVLPQKKTSTRPHPASLPHLPLGFKNDSFSLASTPSPSSSSNHFLSSLQQQQQPPLQSSTSSSKLNSPFNPHSGIPSYQPEPRKDLQIGFQNSSFDPSNPLKNSQNSPRNSLQNRANPEHPDPERHNSSNNAPKRKQRSPSPVDEYVRLGFERLKLFESRKIYSQTGFDLMGALARVERRPNPQISIGPVDDSAAIVIVDAKQKDFPIIFATPSFSSMTGYDLNEILGKNCRFLQYRPSDPRHLKQQKTSASQKIESPKLNEKNSLNNQPLEKIKRKIFQGEETQSTLINYRKDGHAFVNLLTVIPITWDSSEIEYFVGFQVDVVHQTDMIFNEIQRTRYLNTFHSQNPSIDSQKRSMIKSFSGSTSRPFANENSTSVPPAGGFQKFQEVDASPNSQSKALIDHAKNRISEPVLNFSSLSHKSILAESRDLILAVSLKGRLFYVSRSCERHLGYKQDELISENISKICHGTDLTMILRQLKEIGNTANTPISLNFRSIKKDGSLEWMEFEGKLHLEPGKGRKYVVMVGRPKQIGKIKWGAIKSLSLREFWMRLSREALCLYCTTKVEGLLGYPVRAIIGRSLIELSETPEKGLRILEKIHQVEVTGEPRSLKQSLAHQGGAMVEVNLKIYPSHPTLIGHMREFYCQVNLCEDPNNTDYDDSQRQHFESDINLPNNNNNNPTLSDHQNSQLSSDNSPFSNNYQSIKLDSNMSDSNLFSQLETFKTTAWNLELSELKQRNKILKNEIIKKGLEGFL